MDPSQWRYVVSADHASFGLTAKELTQSHLFTGPSFQWQPELLKEKIKVGEIGGEDPEHKWTHVYTTKAMKEGLCQIIAKGFQMVKN